MAIPDPVDLAPVPLTIEELCNQVRADLVARNTLTSEQVVFGDWEQFRQKDAPRVIFGLGTGRFRFGLGGEARFPGMAYTWQEGEPPEAPTYTARSVATVTDYGTVTVLGTREVLRGDAPALTSQRSTAALRNKVAAALYRAAHGSIEWGGGTWLKPMKAEFQFGSVLQFEIGLMSPILDDAKIAVIPDQIVGTMEAEFETSTHVDGNPVVVKF